MRRNAEKFREIQRNSEKCIKTQKNAEKCREVQICRDILMTFMTHGNVTFDILEHAELLKI